MTTDEGKMSFLEHLGELRTRIVWSLIPTAVGLIVAFRFSDRILQFIRRPLDRANARSAAGAVKLITAHSEISDRARDIEPVSKNATTAGCRSSIRR